MQVSRAKLIDLMQGERKNEVLKPRPLGVAVFQFLLGVVFLAAAYAILLTFGMYPTMHWLIHLAHCTPAAFAESCVYKSRYPKYS